MVGEADPVIKSADLRAPFGVFLLIKGPPKVLGGERADDEYC